MENKTSGLKGSQVGHYPDWEGCSIITIISRLPTVKRRGPFKINLICLGQIIPQVKILLCSPASFSFSQSLLATSTHLTSIHLPTFIVLYGSGKGISV